MNSTVYCYIIESNYGTYYCGITNNVIRRFNEHRQGQSSYLRKFGVKELVYTIELQDRSTARSQEVYIKKYGVAKYVKYLRINNKI